MSKGWSLIYQRAYSARTTRTDDFPPSFRRRTAAHFRSSLIYLPQSAMATSSSALKDNDETPIKFNFLRGHPNHQLLPTKEMQAILLEAASEANSHNLTTSLNYLPSDQGDSALLQELALFLGRQTADDDIGEIPHGLSKTPWKHNPDNCNQFFLTHGVSHGLELLCRTQTQPGDVVWIERPTYFLVNTIFQSHGLVVESLPMATSSSETSDSAGAFLDLDRLEDGLNSGALTPPRMIYIIPSHQNPTAKCYSIEERWRLAKLAARHGILLVSDEVYHLLDWRTVEQDEKRPAYMARLGTYLMEYARYKQTQYTTIDNPKQLGACVTLSSFTKIFGPGVRLGWIEGPKEIIDSLVNLGYIQSQGGCAPFIGELMRISLHRRIGDSVLQNLNRCYQQRSQLLVDILATEPRIQIAHRPIGGYFVWVTFESIRNVTEFLEYCRKRGLIFLTGDRCDVFSGQQNETKSGLSRNVCSSSARLCFADMDIQDLEQGAKLLVELYKDFPKFYGQYKEEDDGDAKKEY